MIRFEPGFVADLKRDLMNVDEDTKVRLARVGSLTEDELLRLVTNPPNHDVFDVDHPAINDVVPYDDLTSWQLGVEAVDRGEVAFVVLAGGTETHLGLPEALTKLPRLGISLLAIKLTQASFMTKDSHHKTPVWIMTSPASFAQVGEHIASINSPASGVIFEQFQSYRLLPNNSLSWMPDGQPNLYPTGHGDVGPALVESGILEQHANVKHVVIVNCDNVLASLDPHVIGHHIKSGNDVTCEVVKRQKGDAGGVLCWANKLQAIECFRLPTNFVDEAVYQNTNTFVVNVAALKRNMTWRWHRVRKLVDNTIFVQHERLLQQLTEEHSTGYVLVDRERRYLPVKTKAGLVAADNLLSWEK